VNPRIPSGTSLALLSRREAVSMPVRKPAARLSTPAINDLWYKNAIIYCLSVAG
jgi:hypothetical protein